MIIKYVLLIYAFNFGCSMVQSKKIIQRFENAIKSRNFTLLNISASVNYAFTRYIFLHFTAWRP